MNALQLVRSRAFRCSTSPTTNGSRTKVRVGDGCEGTHWREYMVNKFY